MTTSDNTKTSFLTLRNIQLLSIVFGLVVSGYLSYLKITDVPSVCIENGPFNCEVVLNSVYSEFSGIPIAYLGFLTYAIIGFAVFFEHRIAFFQDYGELITFGVGLFAWMFSMWLVYVQFILLETLCPWCLSHEINFTLQFGIICYRLYQDMTAVVEEAD